MHVKREVLKEEQERRERHRESARLYDERKRKKAKLAEADAKLRDLRAAAKKEREEKNCPTVYKVDSKI